MMNDEQFKKVWEMKRDFLKKCWKRVAADEQGATAIEYGLFAALIAVVIIFAVTNIGNSLNDVFTLVANKLNAVTP